MLSSLCCRPPPGRGPSGFGGYAHLLELGMLRHQGEGCTPMLGTPTTYRWRVSSPERCAEEKGLEGRCTCSGTDFAMAMCCGWVD
jgi:hypothetical protein